MACAIVIYMPDHGYTDGNRVVISGVLGLTDSNDTFEVFNSDDDSFKLKDKDSGEVVTSEQTYTGRGVAKEQKLVFDGLGYLEGETVAIHGDGAVMPTQIVSGGQVTIDDPVSDVCHVGLPFTYQVSPMRLDVSTQTGTTHGSIKKIFELAISLFRSGGVRYGDGVNTYGIDFRTTEDYGSPPNLFTGDRIVSFGGGYNTEDNIIISGSNPLPCTVRALIPRVNKTGR